MHRVVAVVTTIVILGLVNWSIIQKEKHLAEGRRVNLSLMPVDPRSLMQGDYMALRFSLAEKVRAALPQVKSSTGQRHGILATSDGHVVVKLDEQSIGTFKSIYSGKTLANNEILMHYRVRNGKVKLATNAYFFQEGHAKKYESAKFGQFAVNKEGELLLVLMLDEHLNKID